MPKKKTVFVEGVECKECSICGKIVPLTSFHVHGKHKNGETQYRAECKECTSKYQMTNKEAISTKKKIHRSQHKEEIAEKDRIRYHENKEIILEKRKKYANEHKEEISTKKKIHYNEHREELLTKKKTHYDENKEELIERQKIYYDENKEEILTRIHEDRKLNPEKWKIRAAKHYNDRRGLGNDYINEPFENGVFHHLGTAPDGRHDKDTTVCVPNEVHGNDHYVYAPNTGKHGKNMIKKNTEMFLWLIENHPEDKENIEYLYDVMSATIQRTLDGWEEAEGWKEWVQSKENIIKVDERETLDYWF